MASISFVVSLSAVLEVTSVLERLGRGYRQSRGGEMADSSLALVFETIRSPFNIFPLVSLLFEHVRFWGPNPYYIWAAKLSFAFPRLLLLILLLLIILDRR